MQTCSSGTAALHIAVAAAGIGLGDEVITSPVTDIGTVIGVIYQQAVPVFADLGAGTYNLDVADVERRITPKTKAIIAVHLTRQSLRPGRPEGPGRPPQPGPDRGLRQAWGAKYRGRPIGTRGPFRLLLAAELASTSPAATAASSPRNDERFGPLLQKFGDKGCDRIKWGGLRRSPPTTA